MGLDMYLTAHGYLSSHREGDDDKSQKIGEIMGSPFRVKEVRADAGYWRKANAIHRWFVENVQDDEDNCQEYDVDDDQLRELLECCRAVLADPSKAEELLPPQEGFFFGSTEIDDGYWHDIAQTIKICENVLDNLPDGWWLTYRASW